MSHPYRNRLGVIVVGCVTSAALSACGARTSTLPPAVPATQRLASGSRPPIVWLQPEMVRVGPSAQPRFARRTMHLEGARNESVSFQIVVTAPKGGLSNVGITAGAFANGVGTKAPIESALYREHFVSVTHASPVYGHPKSLGAGIYPDGLIPFVDDVTGKPPKSSRLRAQPIAIAEGRTQPYWVDVNVPPKTVSGDYGASFTVASDQGSVVADVMLHVWRFTMPLVPSVDSDFEFDHSSDADLSSQEELLRHRLQPSPVKRSRERMLADTFGLRLANLGFWGGAYYGHCDLSDPPSVNVLENAVDRQALRYLYDQAADEIGSCKNFNDTLVPIMKHWARNLHAVGALNLLTMQPVAALEDDGSGTGRSAVDIWTMLPPEFDRSVQEVRKVLAKGDRAWWYTALSQDRYSPKWEIDVPPGDYRIEALIDENLGLTGELYWAVDFWHRDAWNDVEYDAGGGQFFAGEGILLYPGSDVGTVGAAPSMRLKWIRDGMYDADEVALLEKCGLREWALSQTRAIATDFHHWTDDPAKIDDVHRVLAKRLDSACGDRI